MVIKTIEEEECVIESCIELHRRSNFDCRYANEEENVIKLISCDEPIKNLSNQKIGKFNYAYENKNQLVVKKTERRKVSREEKLVLLLRMNENYAKVPSCFGNLMEDRIEAHKFTGIRSTTDLASLSYKLSMIVSSDSDSETCIKRNFVAIGNKMVPKNNGLKVSSNKNNQVKIMSWNVLSQAIGYHMDKFSTCSQFDLSWPSRKWKVIHELAQYSPDIICLQEVDKFYFIHKLLQKVGYDGKFVPKPDSPCNYLPSNTGPDGCAIFYDTNKFTLIHSSSRILNVCFIPSNQVALLCTFKCKAQNRIFIVATTHFKARKSELLATLRTEQAHDLLTFIDEYMLKYCYDRESTPIIITGDFNGEKCEPFYETMTTTLASAYDIKCSNISGRNIQNIEESNILERNIQNIEYLNNHSNWTRRVNEEEIKQTIDYIFYDAKHLRVETLLELGASNLQTPIPNSKYPSDHLSLVATFSFL